MEVLLFKAYPVGGVMNSMTIKKRVNGGTGNRTENRKQKTRNGNIPNMNEAFAFAIIDSWNTKLPQQNCAICGEAGSSSTSLGRQTCDVDKPLQFFLPDLDQVLHGMIVR